MAIIPKQIGWSQESNLLWNISSQLDRLTKVIANLSPGGGGTNIYNSDGTLTGPRDVFCSQHNLRFREVQLIRFDDLSFADSFIIDFSGGNEKIYTRFNNNDIGLKLDFANTIYQFGQLTGGNATFLTIDDTAAYPVQLTGTNISSGTAGSASGQFLKIKVGGVDYKIALLNP